MDELALRFVSIIACTVFRKEHTLRRITNIKEKHQSVQFSVAVGAGVFTILLLVAA